MKTPLNINTVSQPGPQAGRSREFRALPTRKWLVDAGLRMDSNPGWDAHWNGVSLRVTPCPGSTGIECKSAQESLPENVVRFVSPALDAVRLESGDRHSRQGMMDTEFKSVELGPRDCATVDLSNGDTMDEFVIHRVDFRRSGTDQSDDATEHDLNQLRSHRGEVGRSEAIPAQETASAGVNTGGHERFFEHPMSIHWTYRSGLRSRPAQLSRLSVSPEFCRRDSVMPRMSIADQIRMDRVLGELKGMNWSAYPVGRFSHER